MSWTPILEGELADRARRVAREILDALAEHEEPSADLALTWAYAANVFDDAATQERAQSALERLGARLDQYKTPALYSGLAGAGWVIAHVTSESDDVLERIDNVLLELLAKPPRVYDLISGTVGFAVYFLERDGVTTPRALAKIVEHLEATCERDASGATWHTPPEELPPHQREVWQGGYYNCGLAHGVPGVVAVLAKIAARADAPPAAAGLRDDATRWLLAQQRDNVFPAMFDAAYGAPGVNAWCYGEPGITIALWGAALRSGAPTAPFEPIVRTWLQVTEARDPMLCHGAGGLMHLCNRFYQTTRDPMFRDAARAWCERALAWQRPGEGVGGFLAHDANSPTGTRPNAAFLDGSAGLALALLAAVTDLEPGWDRLMLCDLPVE